MMIMYFAMEITYDSNVEYIVNSQGLNRLKAYYAAKSGMQLSLLRIKIYQQVQSKYGKMLGNNSAMINMIWQFPFAWPLPIPDEMDAVDKDAFLKLQKDSSMDASYMVTIEDEGSKIDINDLNSPSKTLADLTKKQLLGIFEQKMKEDQDFAQRNASVRFDELVNNIADWMTNKNTSLTGGDKRSRYAEITQEAQGDTYPPNRAFRTVQELHFVPTMTDEFFDLLAPRITIYGMKGINPNIATKEVIRSLDPGMTDDAASAAIKRRDTVAEGGPFKDANDFWTYVNTHGARLENPTDQIPLIFDSVMNFRIISTGEYAGATREITAVVMDLNRMAAKVKDYVSKDQPQNTAGKTPQQQQQAQQQQQQTQQNSSAPTQLPPGPPRIVYWNER